MWAIAEDVALLVLLCVLMMIKGVAWKWVNSNSNCIFIKLITLLLTEHNYNHIHRHKDNTNIIPKHINLINKLNYPLPMQHLQP